MKDYVPRIIKDRLSQAVLKALGLLNGVKWVMNRLMKMIK